MIRQGWLGWKKKEERRKKEKGRRKIFKFGFSINNGTTFWQQFRVL